jgi:hypothetical protein
MSDGRRARVRQLPRLGEGLPGSREEEGEGGEGFISPKRVGALIYSHPLGGGAAGPSKEPKCVGDRLYVSVSSSCHAIPPNVSYVFSSQGLSFPQWYSCTS